MPIDVGFLTEEMLISEVIPLPSLYSHNPEFPESRDESPINSMSINTGTNADTSENVSIVSLTVSVSKEPAIEVNSATKVLEIVRLWVSISLGSFPLSTSDLGPLPYFCHFVHMERDQDMSQPCLLALYCSVSILPLKIRKGHIQVCL